MHTLGDDPNFWLALTHQAEAKSVSKKVKRMLLDLNLASETGGKGGAGGGGGAGDEGGALHSAFARDGVTRSMSVMSSLRGLGAGISKFFATASLMGSRAPSLTPPPSELTTLTTNSVIATGLAPGQGPLAGAPWALGASGVVTSPAAGGAGGCGAAAGTAGSSGGASSAGTSVPPSPVGSVLGVHPAALATRMRLLRSPLPVQPQGPVSAAPPPQEMTTGGVVPSGAADASAVSLPLPPPAAAPAHHHYRVAHMRTITEENLDALLRPGSSGGVDLLAGTPPPLTPRGPSRMGDGELEGAAQAAGAAAGAHAGSRSPPPRRRAELLDTTIEAGDSGSGSSSISGRSSRSGRSEAEAAERRGDEPPGLRARGGNLEAGSPFASCSMLAGSIAQEGVAALSDSAEAGAVAASGTAAAEDVGPSAASPRDAAAASAPSATPAGPGGLRITPPAAGIWACAPSPVTFGPGPVGGAQVGAGDVPAVALMPRHTPPPGVAPEDLRLVMGARTPCGASSEACSDAAIEAAGLDTWAAEAAALGE